MTSTPDRLSRGEDGPEETVIYRNGRRGRQQAEVALQIESDKEAHIVVIEEALKDQEKRPTHNLTWNSKYISVYTRRDRHIRVERMGKGTWALIGGSVVAAYLPPQLNHHDLARALGGMAIADTIRGDLNACGGSKKRRLEEYIEKEQLDNIGREAHTHVWGNHRCRIGRVLIRGRGTPWVFKEGWECDNDHTVVAAKVKAEAATLECIEMDWDQVRGWLAEQEE